MHSSRKRKRCFSTEYKSRTGRKAGFELMKMKSRIITKITLQASFFSTMSISRSFPLSNFVHFP